MGTDTHAATVGDAQQDPQTKKLELEIENLRHENEKLTFELAELRNERAWERRLKSLLPTLTAVIAVAGFWFGIVQSVRAEFTARKDRLIAEGKRKEERDEENRLYRQELTRETARPLWDRQLALYIEATEKAATIATVANEELRTAAEARFWILYWGPLAAVEDVGITKLSK